MEINELLSIIAHIIAYVLAGVLIVQLVRYLLGGTWSIEDIILGLVILNLTITFSIGGYLLHLNNKIAVVDKRIHGHFEWHRGSKK